MILTKNQIAIIVIAILVVGGVWAIVHFGSRGSGQPAAVALSIWGVDPPSYFEKTIADYKAYRPNVTIAYKQVPEAGYREAILEAMAAGQGPDVYMVANHWIPKEKTRLAPADPSQVTPLLLQSSFPGAVATDVAVGTSTYALPLYFDTLALVYNRDLFDQAGIVYPPADWSTFQSEVNQLKQVNPNNQITRAGAALGTSEPSVKWAPDIVELLMMQNGVPMTDSAGSRATFSTPRAVQAFNYYLAFADAASPYYTWNAAQSDSLSSFAAGNAAMVFAYHDDLSDISAKSPFLNFRVAPVPQVSTSTKVTIPRYFGLAVSRRSGNSGWGWDFVVFATTNAAAARDYAAASGRPPALLSLVNANLANVNLSVFAAQALTARSWYQADSDTIQRVFNAMIDGALRGRFSTDQGLSQAQDQVSRLMGTQ